VKIGGLYTITPITFILGSVFSQVLKKQQIERRLVIMIGSILNAVSFILMGPSIALGMNQDKVSIVAGGCILLGIGCGFVFPNALPEICF